MNLIRNVKKSESISYAVLVFFIAVMSMLLAAIPVQGFSTFAETSESPNFENVISSLFAVRDSCVFLGNTDPLKKVFVTDERNGRWALEYEGARASYLAQWAAKQGVSFRDIHTDIQILRSRAVGRGYAFYLVASTEYTYAYSDTPDTTTSFRLGSYHSLDLIPGEAAGTWVISREWYDDPFAKSFDDSLYTPEMTNTITSHTPADHSQLSAARLGAVRYADQYCGKASDGSNGYLYNTEYTDYNALGGNCANFASQVLFEGGGFKKTSRWNYRNGKGSRAWINAQGFKDFLIYSGRGSLIARGKYADVHQAVFDLLPGDIIAYADRSGITHISVVTDQDSKGCPLVNSHNLDRYRVPWDIGWNAAGYSFYLIRMNY
jgi:hypothetical protein